jgi:hypothetical protein
MYYNNGNKIYWKLFDKLSFCKWRYKIRASQIEYYSAFKYYKTLL